MKPLKCSSLCSTISFTWTYTKEIIKSVSKQLSSRELTSDSVEDFKNQKGVVRETIRVVLEGVPSTKQNAIQPLDAMLQNWYLLPWKDVQLDCHV